MSLDAPIPLALFTGRPAFAEPLHVGRPNMGDRDALMRRIGEILDRKWFTNDGPCVREFEKKVAEVTQVEHCVSICNATIALEILFRALGMKGEVLVPAYTFVATAHALQWQEIEPVLCDVLPGTHNLDPAEVERRITPRTSGIVGVHLWGRACDTAALQAVADRHGLPLVYDAAHAFGCSHGGRMVGGFGRAEVFSFHATKFVNSFEGGAIVTNDGELAKKARLMRNFGFAGKDRVIYVGSNGKMSEVCAAMGLTSIEALGALAEAYRVRHARYTERLSRIPGFAVARYDEGERCNWSYVVAEVDAARAGLTRDDVVAVLEAENVLARRYFAPGVHRMEPYRSLVPPESRGLPVTERLSDTVIAFPTGTGVSLDDVDRVCGIVAAACAHAPAVRARLAAQR